MNTALANLTWKGKWFHSKGMSVSNVCFDHFFVWFWCPLKVKRKLNIINCCLVTDYVTVFLLIRFIKKTLHFMIVGVSVRGHKSFYAYDLEEITKKNQCEKWSNKSLPESKLQEKKCVLSCPPPLTSLWHKPINLLSCVLSYSLLLLQWMSRREMGMRLQTTDNNIINFVI